MDIQNIRVNTAGAYVRYDGLYLFALGIRPHQGKIPIVRLGGHRQEYETGWQCAVREVREEANLAIQPLLPGRTYLSGWDHIDAEFQPVGWETGTEAEPPPILVVAYQGKMDKHLSLMYLAEAEGVPVPSSEVKGLILLPEEEIHAICKNPPTLEQYLNRGGKALFREKFDTTLVLEPFIQFRLLSKILCGQSK